MFCAVKDETPLPIVVIDVTAKVLSLVAAENPAITDSPQELIRLCIKRFPTDTKLDCNILGTAIKRIVVSICKENRGGFSSTVIFLSLKIIRTKALMHAAPCAINVATAAPATP